MNFQNMCAKKALRWSKLLQIVPMFEVHAQLFHILMVTSLVDFFNYKMCNCILSYIALNAIFSKHLS